MSMIFSYVDERYSGNLKTIKIVAAILNLPTNQDRHFSQNLVVLYVKKCWDPSPHMIINYHLIFWPIDGVRYIQIYLILLTCLWHQNTKPRILQFTNLKCCMKAREPFKPGYNGALFLFYYFKKYFKPCFFILKALEDILQHFKFVNWWFRFFDVTNRLDI